MLRHFLALIVGHRQAALGVNSVQHCAETLNSGLRITVCHFGQGHKQARSFNERTNSRCVATTFDQVALPVTRNHTVIHFLRSLVGADHIGNFATAVFTTRTWTTRFARLPKRCKQFCTQFTTRRGIKRRVDGFLSETHREIIRVHTLSTVTNFARF